MSQTPADHVGECPWMGYSGCYSKGTRSAGVQRQCTSAVGGVDLPDRVFRAYAIVPFRPGERWAEVVAASGDRNE
jgi:hypothetical protein